MCRRNQMYGGSLLAFGLGILVGTWLTGVVLCHLLGIGLGVLGFCVMTRT